MTVLEHERSRALTDFAVEQGERWRQEKAAEFKSLPIGTAVMLNVVNGKYVTGATRIEVMDKFDQAFGKGVTIGYSFKIGRPTFVGGGIG